MRSQPPRDAIAATHLWVPVDATGADFYDLGSRFGTRVGVLHEVRVETGHPYATLEGTGLFDPRALRYHRLQRQTPVGDQDNRLSVQVLNDYEAEYEDVRPGDAPFGQPEFFTALNRSTREADTKGRVALPSSHRRIVDSEDDRYALALTCRSLPLGTASLPEVPVSESGQEPGEPPLPEGVSIAEAGTESGSHGSVTRTQPSVSISGITFFGRAAVEAARDAVRRGGSAADVARAASAAARGLPPPPLEDSGTTTQPGVTPDPPPLPPEPDRNPAGSAPLLNRPAGYVWSSAGRTGLLGTLVTPEGAGGSYFAGREGTPIGPLPLRHDAQVSMGPELVGRMVFVSDDAAEVDEGQGKPIKGELWSDTTRANLDTEVGLETTQWRPVIRVNADLPPSRPPPEDPPPYWPPEEEDEEEEPEPRKPRRGPGGGPPPVGGGGGPWPLPPDQGPEAEPGQIGVLPGGVLESLRREAPGNRRGDLGPVENPASQVRDYEGPGVPCPNVTAGVFVATGGRSNDVGTRVAGIPVRRVPGGYVQYSGYPAITPVPGGLLVGGEQTAALYLGEPTPPQRRRPPNAPAAGDELDADAEARVSELPVGLPSPPGPGFGFDPPLGGGRGIPRGAGERYERAVRKARAQKARKEAEQREQASLDDLRELEDRARAAGRERFARRVQRARERVERRKAKREERRQRREDYKARIREQREARQRRREERRTERRRKREARQRKRSRERMARHDRGERADALPQGGYFIPVTASPTWDTPAFGSWNAANSPLPFFGSEHGPRSMEDWAHLATYQLRALQQIVNGAFGGPGYLAANLGAVHRNRPGSPPSGSRIGAHWSPLPGKTNLRVCQGGAPLEVISVLEAPAGATVEACGGGVLHVIRESRGEGIVDDQRPLVFLENNRSDAPSETTADLISDSQRRFRVTAGAQVTCAGLRAYHKGREEAHLLEIARADHGPHNLEYLVTVHASSGILTAHKGLACNGPLAVDRPGICFPVLGKPGAAFVLRESEKALHLSSSASGVPLRLAIDGDLSLSGELTVAGKADAGAALNSTSVRFSPQAKAPIPAGKCGIWVADGSLPGTVSGGLYFESQDRRVRLDQQPSEEVS